MILAFHDIRREWGRFLGTGLGLGLLFTVVLAMAGIYAGVVEDAVSLVRAMDADLWVVQEGTRGPFADASQVDPALERRVAGTPGVESARAFTYQMVEQEEGGRVLRYALVGLSWPDDTGDRLPLTRGRAIRQARGELLADLSLGLDVGDRLVLAGESFEVVGLTRGVVGFGGDGTLFATVADSHVIAADAPADAIQAERERVRERLRGTDLGRSFPVLDDLAIDERAPRPGLAAPPLAAVLVTADTPAALERLGARIDAWPDVTAHPVSRQATFLLDGVVERARNQLRLFSLMLTATSALIVALILHMRAVERTRDIAILKLMGMSTRRLFAMVLTESWILGLIAYLSARLLGELLFPFFPRRIVLDATIQLAAPLLAIAVTTFASVVGLRYTLRVDPAKAIEG